MLRSYLWMVLFRYEMQHIHETCEYVCTYFMYHSTLCEFLCLCLCKFAESAGITMWTMMLIIIIIIGKNLRSYRWKLLFWQQTRKKNLRLSMGFVWHHCCTSFNFRPSKLDMICYYLHKIVSRGTNNIFYTTVERERDNMLLHCIWVDSGYTATITN